MRSKSQIYRATFSFFISSGFTDERTRRNGQTALGKAQGSGLALRAPKWVAPMAEWAHKWTRSNGRQARWAKRWVRPCLAGAPNGVASEGEWADAQMGAASKPVGGCPGHWAVRWSACACRRGRLRWGLGRAAGAFGMRLMMSCNE